ncbi:hypothetical protein Mycsm_02672 [Mycobacterium sp. JS623]|nr:hypothetical protein Mycsm_02672 [Mycobacterium sp. JS623]
MAAAEAKQAEGVAGDPGTPPLVFVVVNPPYQAVHHGIVFGSGETAEVPEHVAEQWIACGWAVAK